MALSEACRTMGIIRLLLLALSESRGTRLLATKKLHRTRPRQGKVNKRSAFDKQAVFAEGNRKKSVRKDDKSEFVVKGWETVEAEAEAERSERFVCDEDFATFLRRNIWFFFFGLLS